ncbi:MAG: ester cyclase [Prolixibacteraceae bacterium]|nr:ester cyclase [Prolixibacteraceae bacterium]
MDKIDNKTIIRQYVDRIENTGDVSNIGEFISQNYIEVYEGERYPIGIQGAIDHVLGVRRVFPDLKLTIENQISEGEWVVTTYSVTGTFRDEWFGMKPTGKPITFTGVNVDKIADGKIIEHGGAANMFEPLLKAGVIYKK